MPGAPQDFTVSFLPCFLFPVFCALGVIHLEMRNPRFPEGSRARPSTKAKGRLPRVRRLRAIRRHAAIDQLCHELRRYERQNREKARGPPAYRQRPSIYSVQTPVSCLLFPASSYCTALIMSKIGRYIATTIPPTMTPRNTIMIGSSSDSRPLTAASTSSS